MLTEDGPHPLGQLGTIAAKRNIVVRAGRATRVPQAAVTSGMQRSVTVTSRGPLSWMLPTDLGLRQGGTLHGMQGVRRSNPLSSTRYNASPLTIAVSSAGNLPRKRSERLVLLPRQRGIHRWVLFMFPGEG